MLNEPAQPKISLNYILVFIVAVFFSWILHELAHWLVGEYLGYKMAMTLNGCYPTEGFYRADWHYQVISAAGPVFTIIEATVVYFIMMGSARAILYPILFTCFYMRLFAAVISVLNPNDEARISRALGIGMFTLPLVVSAFLFLLVYRVSKRYHFNMKFTLANIGLTILFTSIIILTDMYLKIRIL